MTEAFESKRQSPDPLERYDTPRWVSRALVVHGPIRAGDRIIEPCAGAGAMTRVFQEAGALVSSFDVHPRAADVAAVDTLRDGFFEAFAASSWGRNVTVATNPPFSKAAAYQRRAARFARCALLVRITWLERCKDREDVPDPVRLIIVPRPKFTGKGGDSATVAWACWGDWAPGIVRLSHDDKAQLMRETAVA